ncbi:MAG: FtsX-like permease family protein [Clostridiales bacterium]|nr:FtsX-like permease family protein [Clostridiales bacterium]
MYAKLICRNAMRSVKDYLIYIVTMTICVTLFYAFLSISSSYYNPDISSEYDFTMLSDGMKAAICMITLLLLFLIRFVNHYMLMRKQKEFAIQSVMGMEQKTIGRIFFAETLIMGIISILMGIFGGVFCSQFITAMLLSAYGKPYKISWTLFPDTVLLTATFFILSFFAVGIFNTRTIRKAKIIEMISAEKENEPELKKSRWIWAVIILFELVTVSAFITGIRNVWFYYDSRYVLTVRLMYADNIIFPAITLIWSVWRLIGRKKSDFNKFVFGLLICAVLNACIAAVVPSLINRYYLPLGSGAINQYLLFILAYLIFSICSAIYLAGSFIVAWKEKSPEHRYKSENLFFFGQIISKLNTTSKTMSIICITLVLAIFMFIAAPILTGWASGYLDIRSMYDVQVYSRYNNVYEEKNLPQDNYEIITDFLAEHEINAAYDCTFNLYLSKKDDFRNRQKYDFPVVAISLSDYNGIREMLGYEQISLEEDEFTTQWQSIATEEERSSFLAEHTSVTTDAGALKLSAKSCYDEAIGETVYNSYTDVLYIFPDNICNELLPVMRNRFITTRETITYENAMELEGLFTKEYPEQAESGVIYGIRFNTLQVNSAIANNFILQSSMLYGAVVLMVICLTVLSLQQLLDAGQYKYRFSVLRQLGVEEKNISRLILKQLSVWFGLPIIIAIVVSAVVISYFIHAISAEISAYIGISALMLQIGATVGILAILLFCYFLSTWVIFRRSINS